MQSTSSILMVRPASFGYNPDTAASNVFQHEPEGDEPRVVRESAVREFDALAQVLRDEGVDVHIYEDSLRPAKPDAVFSNNWISTHPGGQVVLYPMMGENRRQERRMDIIQDLSAYFRVREVLDLSGYEQDGRFLEGTGSLVFDHLHGVVYACRSPRTDEDLVKRVATFLGYEPFVFDAVDTTGQPLYHTNVVLAIGTGFAIVADDTVKDTAQHKALLERLQQGDRHLVKLRPSQLVDFAANALELESRERILVCSERAFHSFSDAQEDILELFARIVSVPVPVIEGIGGGSVRCMMTEIFLPKA